MTTTTQASAKLAVQEWEPYPELEKEEKDMRQRAPE